MTILQKLDQVEKILKHQPGRHDQGKHAGSRTAGSSRPKESVRIAQNKSDTIAEDLADIIGDNARATDIKDGKSSIRLFAEERYDKKLRKHLNSFSKTGRAPYSYKFDRISPTRVNVELDFGELNYED